MNYGDIRDTLIRLPYPPDDGLAYALTDLFTVRHEIIRQLEPKPTSVFEFGALRGFFLVTALDALGASMTSGFQIVGWCDNEFHTPGSNLMCETNIRAVVPGIETHVRGFFLAPLYAYCTDRDQIPADARFDLVQVDSDHSVWGCLQDLRAAVKLEPRWIMVDDWTSSSHRIEIREAVQVWLDEEEEAGRQWTQSEHETKNGLLLLTRSGDSQD